MGNVFQGRAPAPQPAAKTASADSLVLTESDYAEAAREIGCEPAAIRAVAEVESAGRGFLPDGRPAILFEAHIFDRLTKGAFRGLRDRNGVALSVPAWDRTLYGPPGEHQYARLADAAALDEQMAAFATSWGTYQVMGFNFGALGFPTVDTLVEFMETTDTAREHLDLFVRYIRVNGLDDELRNLDWRGFARLYNGPGYEANAYHTKMAAAYRRHAG